MGMYDDINYECVCPVCRNKVDGFQSKSADCVLDTLEPDAVSNFYSPCRTCGCWLDFTRQENGKYLRVVHGKDWKMLPQHKKQISI